MRVAFFTEGGWIGKVPRDHPNMRTDLAWECALGADHYPIPRRAKYPPTNVDDYDLGIIIVPKKNPATAFDGYAAINMMCVKVAVMQEGPNWFWQDWDLTTQVEYINLLQSVDYIFCHNESDRKYYAGLLGRDAHVLPTLMIEDAIDIKSLCAPSDRSGVMIGGNFVSWYGGFDSYMIAQEFGENIYAPSMGRKQDGEDAATEITHLPYMRWREWITELSKRKYAVHLMRTHAAGTFALNCAYLGIPCIGWKGLDTQEKCFPKLTFDVGDMEGVRHITKHLATSTLFYDHVVQIAKDNYKEYFGENVFLEKFNNM